MARPETQAAIAAAHARIDRTYTGLVTMSDEGRSLTVTDSVTGEMKISALDDRFSLLHDGDVVRLTVNEDGTGLEAFEHLWYANGRDASQKSPLNVLRSKERARLFEGPPARKRWPHALIAARQWIPREHAGDLAKQQIMGLPDDLVFRTKGQLAIDLLTEVFADGIGLDFVCGDEVYGSCTQLREYLEGRGQGYVLRVPSNFHLTVARGVKLSCKQAAAHLLAGDRRWEVRSAGKGSKGARWYAWAWLATISARHYLLIRRHRVTGELAFHYCHVPQGQPLSLSRLIRAAGLRWPAEENFQFSNGCFGPGQSQVRLCTAIARHTVLVMAALAICAITAALPRRRTSTQARAPARPDQPPPADAGMIPLTVPETGRLPGHPPPPGAAGHWLDWRRRHQARSAWYHQRTRLARDAQISLVS
jgi:hypothetical protein